MTELDTYTAPAGQVDRITSEQLRHIANTEIVPKHLRGKPDAIMATILKGRALGLDDIHSLTAIHFIDGKATLAAETMVTLVRRAGHSLKTEAKAGASVTVTGRRRDNDDTFTVTWTMERARSAGLVGKDNWKRYPDTMLAWRATSEVCRFLFPDVLMGVSYTVDEAEEASERGAVTSAVSDLPAVEEPHVRTEPKAMPSEAQLNRIAHLEERAPVGAVSITLRGVFGVEMASELDADQAARYENMLTAALPPQDSAEGPSGSETSPTGGNQGLPADASGGPNTEEAASPSAETSGAETSLAEATDDDSSAPEDLPGEPGPDDVVEGEFTEEPDEDAVPRERLIELAGETPIPSGNYRGQLLKDIHDGWLEFALRPANVERLPAAFVEALELYAQERRPEIWKAVRG